MSLLPEITLADDEKLAALRKLDQHRRWYSLDDRRYCLGCRSLLTGREVQLVGGTRGTGPLRLVCPTPRCPAIPMDWVLPTEEMLAQVEKPREAALVVRAGMRKGFPKQSHGLRKSWHRWTARFRRAV